MNSRVLTVIEYEFLTFIKNKAFIILTAVFTLLAFAAFFIPGILGGNAAAAEPPAVTPAEKSILRVAGVADLDLLGELLPAFQLQASDAVAKDDLIRAFAAEPRLYGLLDVSEAAAALQVNRLGIGDPQPGLIQDAVKQYRAATALQAAGVDRAAALASVTAPTFTVSELASDIGKSQTQTYMYTYIILMWLYMAVLIYGQIVAGNVASEKGNRTMELLITSTKPINLLVGKVVGTGLAGLLQIFLILAAALVSYRINHGQLGGLFGVPAITPAMLGYTLLFFLLGYFTFAFLFSALGSLVNRSEDVNKSVMSVSMPLVVIFIVAMSALFVPASGHVTVLSFVPFFSPFLMFVRTQMLAVPAWQVIVSVLIGLATMVGMAFISGKIYRLGTLFYGNTVKLKSLFRMLKY